MDYLRYMFLAPNTEKRAILVVCLNGHAEAILMNTLKICVGEKIMIKNDYNGSLSGMGMIIMHILDWDTCNFMSELYC